MARKLDSYREKRDPTRTNEPFGAEPMDSSKGTSATLAGRFVVHLHAASRMHYDLRIEIGGTLKSFAVPKGPTLSPAEKHLAMLTEDHPLEYLGFEAVIPSGNYGAGAMIVWDTGTIYYLENDAQTGMSKGKIDFLLWGFKLRGRFALVETKQKTGDKRSWLLLKKADGYARPDSDVRAEEPHSVLSGMQVSELPRAPELAAALHQQALQLGAAKGELRLDSTVPMRCAESDGKLDNPKCLYELKLDGVRLLAERHGDQVQLRYRTGRNATTLFPEIVRALSALPVRRVILDGEVVAFDDRGLPSFAQLAQRIHKQNEHDIAAAAHRKQVQYLVFDILALDDLDLTKLPLLARKQLLAALLRGKGYVRTLDYAVGDGHALLAFCERFELEGVIEKRADSRYVMGPERSRHWTKHKRMHSDDFVVVGYTKSKGGGRVAMGALEIASYVDGQLVTRGRVGSGLSDANVEQLLRALDGLTVKACPASGELLPAPQGRTFVKPELVVSVSHAGFTEEGRLRHPVFLRLRPDAKPTESTAAPEAAREREIIEEAPAAETPKTKVRLTNQRKIFWPGEGITKGDLCEYYAAVAPYLLPYLRDRPVLMVRYPDGIAGKNFYQWNVPVGTPSWVRTAMLHSDEQKRDVVFFRVDDVDTLVLLANLGMIPLHILAGRFSSIDRCDFLTIDFDLGDSTFEHALTLTRELFDILDELALPGFPKTSGQTGLHVLVPMGGAPFEAAVLLANLLGHLVHRRHPQLSTLERLRKNRPNAVYIDTGQTGRSRAIVAPYSVRAVPGATVSTPLAREEVSAALVPGRHTLFSVPGRLATRGDPMASLLAVKPDLTQALSRLKTMLDAAPTR